jgi:hypothetical protein
MAVEIFSNRNPIDRLDHIERSSGLLGFVALERSDEVQLRLEAPRAFGIKVFGQRFLNPIFAKVGAAGLN